MKRFEEYLKGIIATRINISAESQKKYNTVTISGEDGNVYGVFGSGDVWYGTQTTKKTIDISGKVPNEANYLNAKITAWNKLAGESIKKTYSLEPGKRTLILTVKDKSFKNLSPNEYSDTEITERWYATFNAYNKTLVIESETDLPTEAENSEWGFWTDQCRLSYTLEVTPYSRERKYNIKAVNDNFFKAENFIKSETDIIMLLHGGNVTKSNIPNYDLSTMPVIVNFVVPLLNKNEFLGILNKITLEQNGVVDSLNTDISKDYGFEKLRYKIVYNTPFVLGETQEIRCGNGTLKVCTVQWIMTAYYGSNAFLEQPEFILEIGGVDYPINYLMKYESAYAPAYDDYQKFGSSTRESNKLMNIRTYVFQIAKTSISVTAVTDFIDNYYDSDEERNNFIEEAYPAKDRLQHLLLACEWGEAIRGDIYLKNGYFDLDYEEGSISKIKIKHISVSCGYENNSGSYMLTLEA